MTSIEYPTSSPIASSSNYHQSNQRQNNNTSIPQSEPIIPSHSLTTNSPSLSSRSRRSIRSFPRKKYRQVTLTECLDPCPSSPLGLRTLKLKHQPQSPSHRPNFITPSNQDQEASNLIQRPPLAPLIFTPHNHTSLNNRPRFDENLPSSSSPFDNSTRISLPKNPACSSPDQILSSVPSYHPSSPSNVPNVLPRRRPVIDQFFQAEMSYKKPYHFESYNRIKLLESLKSNPLTHTIKMWTSDNEHGYEFPFSLAFNHRAKTGTIGAPADPGELMAVASALGTISLYRPSEIGPVEDRSPITSLEGIANGIFALTFSPSDLMLATGSGAQVSEIFDIESGNAIGRLEGHAATVKTVEFSHYNEQIIATGSRDGSIKIWDLRTVGSQVGDDGVAAHPPVIVIQHAHDEKYTGRKRKKGVHIPSVSSVLWSRLADHHLYSAGSANGVVKLWDIRKKSEFNSKKTHPTPADQSIDHQSTFDLSESMGGEGEENGNFGFDGAISQRPHGISSLVSTSDGARIYALGTDSRIRTHDALFLSRPPSSHLRSFMHSSLIATSLYLKLALSKDDHFLACSSSTGEIYIWDIAHSTLNPSFDLDSDENLDDLIAKNDDGVAIKTTPEDGPVILVGHHKEVCALQFWRQGLASCSDDSSIRLWTYPHALLQKNN